MTDCSCGTCECQDTITRLEMQQLENMHTIANLEIKLEKLQTKKKNMFPENFPQEEEECITCSA